MARAGLGNDWRCVFSNDNDVVKISSYMENWSSEHFLPGDIRLVTADQIPDNLTLAWASSPCQNFSSAGLGDGLSGASSSVFTKWWELIASKTATGREPKIVVLENVVGLLQSRGGLDFKLISQSFVECGYRFGVTMIDAINFLPQSRPRIFFVAVKIDVELPSSLRSDSPISLWHPTQVVKAVEYLPEELRCRHIWWRLPEAVFRTSSLADLMLHDDSSLSWHTDAQTLKLLGSMTPTNLEKIRKAKESGSLVIGTLYRRMRLIDGINKSRAEVRFDGVAGCLRASDGGSSRQMLIYVEGESVRTRHMSPRESARLMGLAETYKLPNLKTHAVKLVGDGVAVPVVKFLEQHLLSPLARAVSIKKDNSAFVSSPKKQLTEVGCLA
ncbi:DNA cytosine methyltransferase [Pseudomonas plecoglossicida]|nr:DNA cytosine methyltransferase [Pseudomonas sp. FFUP_PS_41]PLU90587.1 DNA cytosine methyltransferase [Pseudomonas plecoglossicida]PLV08937.1 DNA cytosine methyltransferase [Pseudomonas plecoglossicida]